jgi:hypothetical protein
MTLFNDGISREPIKNKAEMLRNVVENADLIITAAYGSSKDVPGYQLIHVPADRTFVVGRIKTRFHGQARFLVDGYALHLSKYKKKIESFISNLILLAELAKPGMVRPSKSNSRHLIRRACFNLPKLSSIKTTQSSTSLTLTNQPSSPSTHSTISMPLSHHQPVDQTLSAPLTHRKVTSNDDTSRLHHLTFSTSQSKEAPSRGISPRINRNTTTTNNVYNPSSIEKL